jgi:selenide, water dikinase
VLRYLPTPDDPHILNGFHTLDDAAVYRLDGHTALVQTVDYITPIVDDPFTFGAIAAANALSDIYAMGARPIIALNLVGYPVKTLPMSVLGEILRGGAAKVTEAGASLLGGHSIKDHEPKYGLSITGLVHPEQVITKQGAQPGDLLVLTKPLGIGIITTGIDRKMANDDAVQAAIHWMLKLNREAAEGMQQVGVHAATDVTGFGLLGHLHEMVTASTVGAQIHLSQIPVIASAWELVEQDCVPEGSHNNHSHLADFMDYDTSISHAAELLLCDAQTSGGLLIAVSPQRADELLENLAQSPTPGVVIGKIISQPAGRIQVVA